MPHDGPTRRTTARWVDLSRYGAALKIQPSNALRPAIAVLEVENRNWLLEPHFRALGIERTADFQWEASTENPAVQRLNAALSALGFDMENPQTVPSYGNGATRFRWQYRSLKTRFGVDDLVPAFPGVSLADMVEMPFSAFVVEHEIDAKADWEAYFQSMAEHAKPLWVPREEPLARDYATARPLHELDITYRPDVLTPQWVTARHVLPGHGFDALLRSDYRENAIFTCYVDKASALADGWAEEALTTCDAPHALPLWVTSSGRIHAFRDARLAREIMDARPELVLGSVPARAFEFMRRLPRVRGVIAKEWEHWQGWAQDGATLASSNDLTASFQRVADAMAALDPIVREIGIVSWRETPREGAGDSHATIKPLSMIEPWMLQRLAASMVRLEAVDADVGSIVAILTQVHDFAAGHLLRNEARAEAQAALEALPGQVAEAVGQGDASARHEDVGEHIGGARKDFARRALTLGDLDTFNTAEREALVTKKNVWPPLDYAAMRERGVTAKAAWCIKQLKDAIAVRPTRGRARSRYSEADAHYVEAVAYARDTLATVHTLDDLCAVLPQMYVHGVEAGTGNPLDPNRLPMDGHGFYQIQWGRDFSRLVFDGGARFNNAPGGVPREIAPKLALRVRHDDDWSALIKPKRTRSTDKEETEKAKDEIDRELHRPHLDRVQRSGDDWRQGRDVTGDDLIATFGFRAVEFGNWLPQDERQDVLNMAFDSFADLAQALGLPPSDISLDQSLAIAFGSRGKGGRHAALAHFEPLRNVINLTRMKGAGSLAHEWMHALDHHVGHGRPATGEARINTPWGNLVVDMCLRACTPDELRAKAWADATRGASNVHSWLYAQGAAAQAQLKGTVQMLFDDTQREIDARVAPRIHSFCEGRARVSSSGAGLSADAEYELLQTFSSKLKAACPSRTAFTKVREKIEGNIRFLIEKLSIVSTIDTAAEAKLTLPNAFLGSGNANASEYMIQARKLDKLRSKPYWSTPLEMFARAGAAFVHDRLEQHGRRNDYLVYGAEETRYADNEFGNPNPTGRDREVLRERFEAILDEYLTHQPSPRPG